MSTPLSFVHLHVHTEYSLCDSVVRIQPLMDRVAELKMPSVALTDRSNLFAMVKFYRMAQRKGIKPIVGAEIWLESDSRQDGPTQLVLLCLNEIGYQHLSEIISLAYTQGQKMAGVVVTKEWLAPRTDGLIALSGGCHGDIGKALISGQYDSAQILLKEYQGLFPDRFYLALQRTGREYEESYVKAALRLASTHQVPVVATNDVCFLHEADFDSHEVRVCIQDGRILNDPRRPRRYSNQQYLRSPEEMIALFQDIPEAIENTVEIAKRCNFAPRLDTYYLPDYPMPEGESIDAHFAQVSRESLTVRLAHRQKKESWSEPKREQYQRRLDEEISIITDMGFPGYFLIVADFIQWAKKNGIPVGPGRGSGAGSIVAYALNITDIDPIEYNLLFERFLNAERVSMPDFDVDFCMEGRDRVIDYVASKYGRDQVSQIITFGTMAAKAVVRDVGRVIGHGYGFVDGIAKMIPFEIGMTLSKALDQADNLKQRYNEDEEVKNLIDTALKLEGLSRNAGKHAGGVVIAPKPLTTFTPLYCEKGSASLVTQLDKDDVEAIGLVKFDFLGLRTLTIINWALKAVQSRRQGEDLPATQVEDIPLDDPATFALLKAQKTTAVFQLESSGMKALIKKLQPDCFEDIVALVALFRPGPLDSGMVDDFINRKHGREPVSYPHPDFQYDGLKPILSETYGIILYQEQVMQIAQVMAGYSLGNADLLRRAMGKKKPEEMAKQKAFFIQGCQKNNIDIRLAENIFDLVEKFAGYGFNKSHSVAYALISYQTAWLKTHYPAEFMAAVLSADMDNTDKIVILIEECRKLGLSICPPDVNHSSYRFTVSDDQHIRYGLGALKGVGKNVIEAIESARSKGGDYCDLHDFCRRVDSEKINNRALDALIRGGALDSLGANRATLLNAAADALKLSLQCHRDQLAGQIDIFSVQEQPQSREPVSLPEVEPWDQAYLLAAEKEVLGLYLTGHPFAQYAAEMKAVTQKTLSEYIEYIDGHEMQNRYRQEGVSAVVAGLVINLKYKLTRNGRMAFMTLDDRSGRIDIVVGANELGKYESTIVKDHVLVVKGEIGHDAFTGGYRLRAKEILDMDSVRDGYAVRLTIQLSAQQVDIGFLDTLANILMPYRGGSCPVYVHFSNARAKTCLLFDSSWQLKLREPLLKVLRKKLGDDSVQIIYKNGTAYKAAAA